MCDLSKEHQELIEENALLKQRIRELEKSEAELKRVEETRKEAEDKLRTKEEKYRALFNNARVALFRTRINDGKLMEINKRYAEKTGYSNVEECMAKFNAATAWADPNERKAMLQVLQEKGSVNDYEAEIIRRDGSHIWISFAATIFPEQGVIEGSIVDITDRKRAEDALRERIKELNCIYSIADLVNKTDCMGEIFQETVNLMIHGFRYPEIACARITLGEQEFKTDNFQETKWKMSADLIVQNKTVGLLEICYLNDMPIRYEGPFLKEERSLINATAGHIGKIIERRQVKEALLESEIKFKSITEQALVGTYILQDGIFKYVNPKFAQMFGYTVEECLNNMPFEKLVYPEELANVKEQVRRRTAGEVEFTHYNFRGMKKDGQLFHVEIYGSLSVHQGRSAAAGTLLDVTERRRAEEALLESEIKFKSFAEHSIVGTYILQDDILKYVNPKFAQMFGYTVEECLNKMSFEKLIQPEDLANVKEQIRRRTAGEIELIDYSFKGMKKNGQTFPVEIYGSSSVHEGKSAAAGTLLDITERRQMEIALKESDERFRALFDHSLEGVFIHDLEGNLLDANQAVLDKIGYNRDDIQFLNFSSLLGQKDIDTAMQGIKNFLQKGFQRKPFEFKLRKKDGSYVYVETMSSLIYHNDKPYAVIGIARDITERKRVEEERLRFEKLQGVLEMAGAICHEMNQPMQIISGYSEMLLMNISENYPIHTELSTINEQIQRMGNITKKLMKIKDFDTQDYAGFGRIINIHKSSGNDNE